MNVRPALAGSRSIIIYNGNRDLRRFILNKTAVILPFLI